MIPYEDLVIALQTWRAKQGLPVGQLSGALVPPPVTPQPPVRTGPPVAPPKSAQAAIDQMATIAPPDAPAYAAAEAASDAPLYDATDAPFEEHLDVEDGALLEETNLESEGDYAMAFDAAEIADGESTMIGVAPQPPGSSRKDEW